MSPDSLCRLQVQVSVYCSWWIPAHLKCTQCSILLHLMDICVLQYICLWQISQLQTVCGFVSTSPVFMRSSTSHPAGPHGRFAQITVNRTLLLGREVSTQFVQQFVTAVTAPPLVGCIVWSRFHRLIPIILPHSNYI